MAARCGIPAATRSGDLRGRSGTAVEILRGMVIQFLSGELPHTFRP